MSHEAQEDSYIMLCKNGPVMVTGPVILKDHEQGTFDLTEKKNYFLCRCGASQDKPFCDGAHKSIGWEAEQKARKVGEKES
ncbi:MAG: CDGSH iron-sulfur domain-containing protein [Planctomycetota bacterium]|jgi:CDGSH-type Zn-finger protein|nr:CDGSH iron-sulfur domain-containing protein [Planctomycetota bacterium]MDP6502664.1 CDGSH iron-sulfur domain-containing protein [Planctomycetota bacterium]